MIELTTKADNYAAEKTNEVMVKAIAQAYADGYRDGYKDREEEIPVDLRDNKTEYVDLGLPSGTLWAADFEKDGDKIKYLPYGISELLSIPTKEQWEELRDNCKWEFKIDNSYDLCEAYCVGPNGNILRFERTGKKEVCTHANNWEVFFWIKDEKEGNEKNAIHFYNNGKYRKIKDVSYTIDNFFTGYKLPVRLVRTKYQTK